MVTIYGIKIKILHDGNLIEEFDPGWRDLYDELLLKPSEEPIEGPRIVMDKEIYKEIESYRRECRKNRNDAPKTLVVYKNTWDKWEIVKDKYWDPPYRSTE